MTGLGDGNGQAVTGSDPPLPLITHPVNHTPVTHTPLINAFVIHTPVTHPLVNRTIIHTPHLGRRSDAVGGRVVWGVAPGTRWVGGSVGRRSDEVGGWVVWHLIVKLGLPSR